MGRRAESIHLPLYSDADNEEERDEHRRRESEDMEISAASGSGASFDSGVAPVVEGLVGEEPLETVM